MIIFNLLLVIFLLFLNAFFVAAEFALVGVRKTRMQQLANEGSFNAKLALDAVSHIDNYIAAVQLGITIASLGLGWVGEETIAKLIHPLFEFLPTTAGTVATHTLSVSIAFALITVLHVVIGELMPKSIALQHTEKTTLFVAKPMFVITKLFSPFIFLLNGLGNFLLKLCKIEPSSAHHSVHTAEELNMLINASCEGGALNEEEAEILQNVFKFSDLIAGQVMIPRTDMICISKDISLEDLNKTILEHKYTRYPVYENDLDHIIGFIHTKDLYLSEIQNEEFQLSSLIRELQFIPETMPVDKLITELKMHKSQIAIVIDEFGGTSGFITHEDIMEEIFGEVLDEFDEEEDVDAKQLNENTFEVCGKMRLDAFCEFFNVVLEEDDITTIGGYFVKKLGKIAEVNDKIEDEYFSYCVTKTDSNRIIKLKLEKIDPTTSQTEE